MLKKDASVKQARVRWPRRLRWLRSLTVRLLAVTLLLTTVAVAATTYVTSRQSHDAFEDELRTELAKPQQIVKALREYGVSEGDWDRVADTVSSLAKQYNVRIFITEINGTIVADSDLSSAIPAERVYRIDPSLNIDNKVKLDAIAKAYKAQMNCLDAAGVVYTRKIVDEITRPDILPGVENPNIKRCDDERKARKDLIDPADLEGFPPILVSFGESPVTTGVLLDTGVDARLILTVSSVLLLTILATAFAARRILGPIGRLTAAVRRMQGGHLAERVPVRRSDELGELSAAFNGMATALEDADKIRRRMTSDVAHELRTPLSNIRGYLEAAQDGVAPITAALIDSIHEDTLLLQALVEDLQELTQAEAGQLRLERAPTSLDDLVRSVVDAHSARASQQHLTVAAEGASNTTLDVDPRRLRQVLTNLVENAIRHTDPGGRITVRPLRVDSSTVTIEVVDSGVGIPAEHLARIYDRFYRVDNSRNRSTGGSGLGLAITKELVLAHGGSIDVTSTVGVGTSFVISLPVPPPTGGSQRTSSSIANDTFPLLNGTQSANGASTGGKPPPGHAARQDPPTENGLPARVSSDEQHVHVS